MKNKVLKVLGAGGLALFMGVGTLCGVLIAPMGATSASNAGNLASAAQSADSAFTPQEQLLNGTIKFDPENDPVVFTTDYGLNIRWHMAGEYTGGNKDILESGVKFAGYAYITAGGVNWAIIGIPNEKVNVNEILAGWAFEGDNTPASNAVKDNVSKGKIISASTLSEFCPNAVPSDELEAGEVLCLAQGLLTLFPGVTTTKFNASTSSGNNYKGSNLQDVVDTWYKNNLQSSWDSYIVQKTLTTKHLSTTSSVTAKLFPLAGRDTDESYYWDTYLNDGAGGNMDLGDFWWLRSGSISNFACAHLIYSDGYANYIDGSQYISDVDTSRGVRPAFVLKI